MEVKKGICETSLHTDGTPENPRTSGRRDGENPRKGKCSANEKTNTAALGRQILGTRTTAEGKAAPLAGKKRDIRI